MCTLRTIKQSKLSTRVFVHKFSFLQSMTQAEKLLLEHSMSFVDEKVHTAGFLINVLEAKSHYTYVSNALSEYVSALIAST